LSLLTSAAYLLVLAGLAVFGLHRLHLVSLLGWWPRGPKEAEVPLVWPRVLIQLPLYNEATVVARLIDAVACIDYPRDRLEIQVLDDSTDVTQEIVAERVAWHQALGLSIEHVRRPVRSGFKAGALAYGLEHSSAELVAIFDADFVPQAEFLKQIVPHFRDKAIGMVQAGWGHLNRNENLLTRLQALALDAHFQIEQAARSRSGRFFNFNGTAGMFRRIAIETAGGWGSDTITEDLDLSLRAQLCGWRFLFVEGVSVPAELPANLAAFRTQQKRWARGSGQTARKLMREVWRAPDVALRARIEATFQLSLNAAYPLLLALVVLTVPLVITGSAADLVGLQWALFFMATGSVSLFYVASQRARGLRGVFEALWLTPLLFALGLGLSLSNGLAYLAGLLGGPAPFERTPKAGVTQRQTYRVPADRKLGWAELALGLYSLVGLGFGAAMARPASLPFLLLVAAGFFATSLFTLRRPMHDAPPAKAPGEEPEWQPVAARKRMA
jgi:cellulose synthase/poly-beta-1,6-N-acetylglucosamine synthase-like glycosyltransferase